MTRETQGRGCEIQAVVRLARNSPGMSAPANPTRLVFLLHDGYLTVLTFKSDRGSRRQAVFSPSTTFAT